MFWVSHLHSFYSNCKQLHKAGLLTSLLGNRYRTGKDIHSSGTMSWVGLQPKIRVFGPETLSPEFRGQYLAADGTMSAAAGLWVNTVHVGELLNGDTGVQLVSLLWHVYFWLCPVCLFKHLKANSQQPYPFSLCTSHKSQKCNSYVTTMSSSYLRAVTLILMLFFFNNIFFQDIWFSIVWSISLYPTVTLKLLLGSEVHGHVVQTFSWQ